MGKLKHIIKHLKPSLWPIVITMALLFVQAFCNLALPTYTSDIVNVGIQQGGVDSALPDVMRATTYEDLQLLLMPEQQALFTAAYELNDEGHYALKKLERQQRTDLEAFIGRTMLVFGAASGEGEMSQMLAAQLNLPPGMNMMAMLRAMDNPQRLALLQNIGEKTGQLPDSIVNQVAMAVVKGEYLACGVEMESLQINYLLLSGAKMLGIVLVCVIAAMAVTYLSARIAADFAKRLRDAVFKKVISFSSTEFDHFSTASLITRSTNDIQQVQMMTTMVFRIVLYAPIMGIGGIVMALRTNTSMAWVVGVGVGAIMIVIATLMIVAMPRFKKLQKLVDRLNLVCREILTGIPVIRAFNTQKHEQKRFDNANRDLMKTNLFVNRTMTFMMPVIMLIMNCLTILILYQGARGVDAGQMQVGDMMAFMQYSMQIIMSFLMISMVSVMLPRAGVSLTRINEVLNTETVIHDPRHPEQARTELRGVVEFRNVSFRYPNAEKDVLEDVSFVAQRGETTAFIGSTGSGKSTLINLIPRFFDATKGSVMVGGVDVRAMTQEDLRSRLGYVPQRGVLFSGTIESNLGFGKQGASEAEMAQALSIAQATNFVDAMPQRYQAPIAQGGTNVSGGQKQRLSIARAVIKHPEIYIFDDSFSALDNRTDVNLRRALNAYTKDSTVLIVAQRVSTILHADRIIVLDEGKVVGQGTHEQLLKSCAVYEQIASSQLSQAELETIGEGEVR